LYIQLVLKQLKVSERKMKSFAGIIVFSIVIALIFSLVFSFVYPRVDLDTGIIGLFTLLGLAISLALSAVARAVTKEPNSGKERNED
jgi:uncharacterized membrane protein YagU involved in acid resistance